MSMILFGCTGNSNDVPRELFGIKLGKAYKLGEVTNENFGDFPIKKLVGTETFLGAGVHVYFEPLKANESFSYVEKKRDGSLGDFRTSSFHAYLLPIVPRSITNWSELESYKIQEYKVERIDWSNDKSTRKEAYFWALETCQTFQAQIKIKTEITNNFDLKGDSSFASCTFKQDDRELSIYNLGERVQFELAFTKEAFKAHSDELETFIRKIKAQDMLK